MLSRVLQAKDGGSSHRSELIHPLDSRARRSEPRGRDEAASCAKEPVVSASIADLRQALSALMEGKERARRLIIRAGDHWQVIHNQRSGQLEHVSPRSSRLPASIKLDPAAAQKMRGLDFEKPAAGDWTRRVRADQLDELAVQIVSVLRELHRVDGPMQLDLEIDDREHPVNDKLVEAMRALADKHARTDATRQRMYNAMVNSRFLMPFSPEAEPEADPEDAIERVESRNGRPVFAAFTDFSSMRLWRPLQTEYMPTHGSVLFEWLCEQEAAALLLNPDGRVGGELFANELHMLAEGVRRFVRKHGN